MQRRDRSCARLFGAAVAAVCAVFGAAPSMTAQGTAVARSAARGSNLRTHGFFSERIAQTYIEQAKTAPLRP